MDFIKKHYEKVLLSIVLLGLAVAAAALPLQVSHVNQVLEETRTGVVRTTPKPFQPLDEYLRTNRAVIQRLGSPTDVRFSGIHLVFNPVEWKKRQDGKVVKMPPGNEIGALELTKIEELRLILSFSPAGEAGGAPQYKVSFVRETDRSPKEVTRTLKVGVPGEFFTILKVEGSPEDPSALVVQLKDDKDQLVIKKEGGLNEVIGYAADLKYPPAKQVFSRRRKGDTIKLEDESYKIVSVEPSKVTLAAESTQKRSTLTLHSTAQIQPK
jgi:hypothetical protein